MPRGKGVYVDEDDPNDSRRKAADERADGEDKTPDVQKPEPGSEPPD